MKKHAGFSTDYEKKVKIWNRSHTKPVSYKLEPSFKVKKHPINELLDAYMKDTKRSADCPTVYKEIFELPEAEGMRIETELVPVKIGASSVSTHNPISYFNI